MWFLKRNVKRLIEECTIYCDHLTLLPSVHPKKNRYDESDSFIDKRTTRFNHVFTI